MGNVESVAAISVDGVSVGHGGLPLLSGVTFSVAAGEILAIVGKSGCGKSTLLRVLVGLDRPMAGAVRVCGMNPAEMLRMGGAMAAKTYGVLFQDCALWTSMTLLENVLLPLRNYSRNGEEEIRNLAKFKLALVGLEGFENAYPHEISGGMAKRAAIARAMALDPPILIFDEPSAGLDPCTAKQIDKLILQIRSICGTAIVLISHELGSIGRLSDRVAFMDVETKSMRPIAKLEEMMVTAAADSALRDFFGDRPTRQAALEGFGHET
ncbi:MAG: ATP-binding cassette domain-containing protein [Puniceicoccales bacterium]|jgi:phospholipid/cholesterol/gamma-HCH transport system ATP-binding protein|nr:ATP-binding cassette domain-containing protein [Puniceicoccales bacterium]